MMNTKTAQQEMAGISQNGAKKKRVKTFFASSEIAHIWANEGAIEGHCPSSMRFHGDRFDSYNTTIANRIRYKGRVAYILDVARFSVTTSGHQGHVRHAIPESATVFRIEKGTYGQSLGFTPETLRDYYLEKAKPQKEAQSKLAFVRAREVLRQQDERIKALQVCEYFKLGTTKLETLISKHLAAVTEATSVLEAYDARKAELAATHLERMKVKAIARAEEIASGQREVNDGETFDRTYFGRRPYGATKDEFLAERPDLQQAIDAARMRKAQVKIDAWRKGELSTYQLPNAYDLPTMLRALDPETLETSKGARVPMIEAERAYRFITSRRGQSWRSNGEQCPVGHYKIDAINEAGIVAGCHRIAWDEIELFGASQGW
jgi:hypothetical protein